MNLRYFYTALIALSVSAIAVLYIGRSDDYERSRELIAFRQVGHQILLAARDSVSRVMPVNRSAANQYQLEFENAFAIVPDSLVKTVNRVMQKNNISTDYVVNVVDSESNKLVYGFAISRTSDNILPCMGRLLPQKKYKINIIPEARPASIVAANKFPLFAFFLLVSISGATFLSRRKGTSGHAIPKKIEARTSPLMIGEYLFYPETFLLMHCNTPIILTPKETKLLRIFMTAVNTVIDRQRLLKEGWEDEGVVTQRSLDMYVSRLRKKLIKDPRVKITNVHGRGYCLSTC